MLDSVHGGIHAGRACWVIDGTMCDGIVQGSFAQRIKNCAPCDLYKSVKAEEGAELISTMSLLKMLE
jgi:hypothetical protein